MPQQERAPNAPPVAPNPLELAIYQFEQSAKAYHNKLAQNAPRDETPDQARAREHARKQDWDHLQQQRRHVEVLADIQAKLDAYRDANKSKSTSELLKEDHHPTDKLAMHLTAISEPKPSRNHDPHHIVMGSGRWQKPRMMRSRLNLHLHGIGINDPINGVWLPRKYEHKGHWATPKAPAHKEIHRYNYETWIADIFSLPGLTELTITSRLREVKTMLKFGGYPEKITMPKDAQWKAEV
ncbi:AHH domain-containing protein [Microbulbifer pacificus]|uniref:AHH domain-containing protein n=1 Tax=Microbulbifer pacificus TaxID=407164 RepID=UPI000CF4F690|nr:AHH domain-containing protein [Microbulbifer pacificus]